MAAVERFDVWLERARADALERGLEKGLAPVLRQFERRLSRSLTPDERAQLVDRLDRLGPDRLGDVVLDLDPKALAVWLTDPRARWLAPADEGAVGVTHTHPLARINEAFDLMHAGTSIRTVVAFD